MDKAQKRLMKNSANKGIQTLIDQGYRYDPEYFDKLKAEKTFNPDPSDGVQDCFPISNSSQSFQNITIQGSAVLELTTGSGMFIWLPAWVEKIMCWHIPTDNATKTFGTPERIDYSIDADQFYERYRMLTGMLRIQAGTVSVTNAALAGNLNGVSAYNSLASLVGNNSTVFQIYSYENAPGLSPDIECKVVGIPSWNGVAMLYVNDPDATVQRLEDSVVAKGNGEISAKFVNNSDNYDLNTGYRLSVSERSFSLPMNTSHKIYMGRYLKDGVRASTIDWVFNSDILFTANGGTGLLDKNKLQLTLGYELRDITEALVASGILYTDQFLLPTTDPVPLQGYPFVRSGAFPDNLNCSENDLIPPIREFTWYIEIRNLSTENMEVELREAAGNVRYPVVNGLTQGIIQEPKLVFYTGAEVGTKMNVSGSVRLEAYPDATRSKFVSNMHRVYDSKEADAIKKVLSNPSDYGVRWAMPAANYQNIVDSFTNALMIAREEEPERVFLAVLNQIMDTVKNHYVELPDGSKKSIIHEASLRSLAKKAVRSAKKIGGDVFNSTIKPVLKQEWEVIKALPASAAKQMLNQTFGPLVQTSETYSPPQVSYYTQPNNVVTVSAPRKMAASGYIASTSNLRNYNNACTYEVFDLTSSQDNICYQETYFEIVEDYYYAATKPPKQMTKAQKSEEISDVCTEQFEIPFSKCNVFATINIKQGALYDDGNKTCADGFAIVPKDLVVIPDCGIPVFKMGQKKVHNYSAYAHDADVMRVAPKTDVCLMRIAKVNPGKGVFLVEFTKKPVGGRSLELAMYMYNNGIHGLCCFTGAIEAGRILPMFDSMARTKTMWCHDNHIITVGNGQFDISADSLVSLLTLMRKMTVTTLSPNHHNAATFYDIRNLNFKEFVQLKEFLTSKSIVSFVGDDYPLALDHFFESTSNVIVATNLNQMLPKDFTKYPPLNIKNSDGTYDAFFLPSITTQHSITKNLLQKYWIPPLPACPPYETNPPPNDDMVPMAMNSSPQQNLPFQQSLVSERARNPIQRRNRNRERRNNQASKSLTIPNNVVEGDVPPVRQESSIKKVKKSPNFIDNRIYENEFRKLLKSAKGSFNNDILKEADRIWDKIVVKFTMDDHLKYIVDDLLFQQNFKRSQIASYLRGYLSNRPEPNQDKYWNLGFDQRRSDVQNQNTTVPPQLYSQQLSPEQQNYQQPQDATQNV